jgi:hypothetical protein
MLITFTTTNVRDAIVAQWYNILRHDANKFGVREDLTRGQQKQMAYMKPLFHYLRTGRGKVEGARGPCWRQGHLYYHPKAGDNEPQLHPANNDPHQVPTDLKGEMQTLYAQQWPGCPLRGTPAAPRQQQHQQA